MNRDNLRRINVLMNNTFYAGYFHCWITPSGSSYPYAVIEKETNETYAKLDKEAVKNILGEAPSEIVQQVLEANTASTDL